MIIKKNITKLFILVALLLLTIVYSCQDQEPKLDTYGTLPDFNLVDQYGYDYGKIDTEGKVVLANFVFTGCTQSCPVLTPRFQIVQNLISANDKLSNEVILLSFSVDPEHDVPSVLADYGVKHGVDYNHWRFLTGDAEDIRDVVKIVHDADIEIIANYLFGLPGDTIETMQKTLDLSIDLNSAFLLFVFYAFNCF